MVALETIVLACALGAGGDTVLLDFSSPYCQPCRDMQPIVHRLAEDGFPVQQIDITQRPELAQRFGVSGVPCFVLLSGGRVVDKQSGRTGYSNLVQMFARAGYRPGQAEASRQQEAIRGQSPDGFGDGGFDASSGNAAPPPAMPGFGLPSPAFTAPPSSGSGQAANRATGNRGAPTVAAGNRMMGSGAGASVTAGSRLETTASGSLARGNTAVENWPAGNRGSDNHNAQRSPQQRALRATVRLRLDTQQFRDSATGTIIDTHGDEALIVTCGHLFRDSGGKGTITVEFCGLPGAPPVEGKLIVYEARHRDIALVAIRPPVPVEPMPVAPKGFRVAERVPVFSVGCDHGGEASVRQSRVSGINRYVGPPNIEVSGAPVQGRSGGGLFTADGQLIGICNAADPRDDEGLYAALSTIHEQLAGLGLDRGRGDALAHNGASLPSASQGAPAGQAPPPLATTAGNSQPPPLSPRMPAPRSEELGSLQRSPQDVARGASIADSGVEVIFVVRPRDGSSSRSEAVVIRNPSPELLQMVERESQLGDVRGVAHESSSAVQPWGPERGGRVIRGQSAQ